MTSEIIISMVVGGTIGSIISSGVSFLFWSGIQRKIELRDKQLDGLKETVRALKDEKVNGIEAKLEGAIRDNHEKHGGLHAKIETHAGQLHEKLNRQADVFITRRECTAQHENTNREMENIRKSVDAARGRIDEVAKTVNESATVTHLIAQKMSITLPTVKK